MSDKPKSMKLKFKGDKPSRKHKTRDSGEGSSSRKRKRDEDDEQHDLGQSIILLPIAYNIHTLIQTDLIALSAYRLGVA